jgi:quaternary ammonium compound-resistance protein SugE
LLYKATQELPIGTAYAVWTGIELWNCFSGYRCIQPATFGEFSLTTLITSIVG